MTLSPLFAVMKDIHTFVKHSGRWVKHERYDVGPGCVVGILIPAKATYEEFMQLLYATLNRSPKNQVLRVSYETEGSVPPVSIDSDLSLKCYLHLRKEKPDRSKFSLVVDMEPLKQEPLVSDSGVCSTQPVNQHSRTCRLLSRRLVLPRSPTRIRVIQAHHGRPLRAQALQNGLVRLALERGGRVNALRLPRITKICILTLMCQICTLR